LQPTFDAFARTHGGRAPLVVMPDINGARRQDTECVRTPSGGDVERYLTVDVPRWIAGHLPVTRNHRRWAIAGLSEGGTCAMMLALRHRREFAAFGDLSGLARPTVSDRDDPGRTVRVLFRGSTSDYDRHDPLWLLSHHRYPGLSGWLACGALDRSVRIDQQAVTALARRARITVREDVVPGGHAWKVWRAELRKMLPWLWSLVG
jgi:S-formylglutathione hydrolase FrmB